MFLQKLLYRTIVRQIKVYETVPLNYEFNQKFVRQIKVYETVPLNY